MKRHRLEEGGGLDTVAGRARLSQQQSCVTLTPLTFSSPLHEDASREVMLPLGVALPLVVWCWSQVVKGIQHQGPFFTPCTFPTPRHHPREYHSFCDGNTRLPYLCDLHQQIAHSYTKVIVDAYTKHNRWFMVNSSLTLAVVLVRQLAPPVTEEEVYSNRLEYGCLFDKEDDCVRIDHEKIGRFVRSSKVYARIYSSVLYDRFFDTDSAARNAHCLRPNVLILVATDGLINDARLYPLVHVHSGDPRLKDYFSNIQLETVTAILQGWPMHQVIADLLNQVGDTLADYHKTGGVRKKHFIPAWAIKIFAGCAALVAFALVIEWYVVRRKLAVKRSPSGAPGVPGAKSKTHLMF
uniref:Uncharacterized protein n=1 Tax=Plectus sambesii TaxID=2011161 RepID=A0A914UHC7_9BILA